MKQLIFLITLIIAFSSQAVPVRALVPGQAGSLKLSPSQAVLDVGVPFPVDILFNTGGESISALSVYLTFPVGPNQSMDVVSVQRSLPNDWAVFVPPVQSSLGTTTIQILAAHPYTGFNTTTDTKLATITFKALASFTTDIKVAFDTSQSIMTRKSDTQDVLGSVTDGVYGATLSLTPTPSSIPTTPVLDLSLKLQGLTTSTPQGITIGPSFIIKQGSVVVKTSIANFTAYTNGVFTGSIYPPSPGTYDILVKVPGYLQKKLSNITILNGTNTFDATNTPLMAGDVYGTNASPAPDNIIQLGDLAAMVSAWTQTITPTTPQSVIYDLNFDGSITAADLAIVISNWVTSRVLYGDQ